MIRRLFVLALFAAVAATPSRAQVSGVTAEVVLAQDQYLPDEDLQLKVRIVNRSGQPLTLGQDDQWISFNIFSERNFQVAKLGNMPVAGEFTLLSGQMGSRALNPTPYFDFRRPGHYRIGATIRLEQWGQTIDCKPASFTVANGVPLPNLANLQVGLPLPPGVTNVPPEIRHFSLLKVSYLSELKLYVRLTDDYGRTVRVFPLARMLSFSDPQAQTDRDNNLHVLLQTGARSFTYSVIDPDGRLIAHEMHDYTQTRPNLQVTENGRIFVSGGMRRFAADDVPVPDSANSR